MQDLLDIAEGEVADSDTFSLSTLYESFQSWPALLDLAREEARGVYKIQIEVV